MSIENFSFFLGGPTSTRVTIRGLSLKWTGDAPGRLRLDSSSPGTLLVEIGDARVPFDSLTASVALDGDRVTLSRVSAQSGTARIEADGHGRLDKDYPIDVEYRASIDLTHVAGWWNKTSTWHSSIPIMPIYWKMEELSVPINRRFCAKTTT